MTKRITAWVAFALSVPLYIWLNYFTQRSNFGGLLGAFSLLFLLYTLILWSQGLIFPLQKKAKNSLSLPFLIGAAVFLRLLLLPSIPNLSDDYFRFIWDGRLLTQGISPFLEIPETYMEDPIRAASLGLTDELFAGLNSPKYFTIYPPVNQFVFWLGAWVFPDSITGSVFMMKSCIVLAEVGSIFLLIDLLKQFNLSPFSFTLYAFNPLVIVELCGNLHFEAFLIFFSLLSIWTLLKYPYGVASIPFALAIASKLLPLMFLPLFLRRLGWKKTLAFSLLCFLWVVLMFLPILNLETAFHLASSVGLYFKSFEFNASLYYIVRWIGYQEYGYNIIQSAGKNLGIAVFVAIWLFVWFEKSPDQKSLAKAMMWTLLIYFTAATIVHPWYICTLVALCVLSDYRFPLIWSALLPLTYFTYLTDAYTENLWLVALEYVMLWGYIGWEWYTKNANAHLRN